MYNTTLRGVFPEPKPTHKRNFVKENVKRIKHIQGILQNSDSFDSKPKVAIKKSVKSLSHSKHLLQARSYPTTKFLRSPKKRPANIEKPPNMKSIDISAPSEGPRPNERIIHRAVQTERPEDVTNLYAKGPFVYPSARVAKSPPKKESPRKHDHGDSEGIVVSNPHNMELTDEMESLDLNGKHDYIKENILALKNNKTAKTDIPQEPAPKYQKGVVPKYIKERKEEQKRATDSDPECPPGHVLLPEDERKETLRVLRQSYADRIKELNNMPVSNDTLRRRQRKVAIEEELKKIEEGIRVFQRPKVFVKINA